MVQGERAIGVSVEASWGGSWIGDLFGNSFDMLYELLEDIWAMGRVQGGAEQIASCR
jgi:hypothetical protein